MFDMATDYPNSRIVGIDMCSISPCEIKPKNVTFIKANILDGLPFDDNSFDFIFQRYMFLGIPSDKWNFVIEEFLRVLKPGGYLEVIFFFFGFYCFRRKRTYIKLNIYLFF